MLAAIAARDEHVGRIWEFQQSENANATLGYVEA